LHHLALRIVGDGDKLRFNLFSRHLHRRAANGFGLEESPKIGCFEIRRLRFALGASGHIAGAINPVSKNKRSYWVGETLPASPEAWLAAAVEHPGSWWNDWAAWLEAYKGSERPAPTSLGDAANPPLEPAPGRYVKMKAKPEAGAAALFSQP
jgi:hypothetical protein